MRSRIGLLAQPESMRSIIGATQQERRFDWAWNCLVSRSGAPDDYRNWFASTGLRGQLGRKQFANRVEAADITKSSRRSQGYFFMNVNLRWVRRMYKVYFV